MTTCDTTVDEIGDRVYRISTHSAAGPAGGLTFNQFLIDDDEPVLIHTGMRAHFAQTLAAAARVIATEDLRWITSNHASRPDELCSPVTSSPKPGRRLRSPAPTSLLPPSTTTAEHYRTSLEEAMAHADLAWFTGRLRTSPHRSSAQPCV